MDFTREPIIESVITPKEGCKLVVRSSKSAGQEEHFLDSVEVVSFGNSFFFRSLERPKAFLVPASDYEILEVREARMVLKNVGLDRSIKIGGGREAFVKPTKEIQEKSAPMAEEVIEEVSSQPSPEAKPETRIEKKRDRRRHYRRRRGREENVEGAESRPEESSEGSENAKIEIPEPLEMSSSTLQISPETSVVTPSLVTSLLPPPPTLISETIARYKDNVLFRGAFYTKEESKEEKETVESDEIESESAEFPDDRILLEQPAYGSFEVTEQEEEEIFKERQKRKRQRVNHESIEEEELESHPNKGEFLISPEKGDSQESQNQHSPNDL